MMLKASVLFIMHSDYVLQKSVLAYFFEVLNYDAQAVTVM